MEEYRIKEAILLWLNSNGYNVKVKSYVQDIILRKNDVGSYEAEIQVNAEEIK
jgi:hypothetical protein